jgi:hypothetical protein
MLHLARKREGRAAYLEKCPSPFDPDDDMYAARPRRLWPANETNIVQRRTDDARNLLKLAPLDARHWIEIDPQFVGMVEIVGTDGMRMKFETCKIGHPRKRGGVAWHEFFRCPSRRE